MANTYRFLAIDGALNNFGLARGYVVDQSIYIERIELISPKKGNFARGRMGDAARAKFIVQRIAPHLLNVNIVFAELAIGSRSASAAWSLGVALGIIASIDKPIILVQPHEAKKIVKSYADKDEIIAWATKRYPHLDWLKYRGRITKKNEHTADAIAIAHAGARKINNGTKPHI